jgi:predicted DNA binding protein
MGLLVELRVSGDPIVLPDVAAGLPDVTLEIEQWRRYEDRVHWFLWARGEDLDRVDEAFAAIDHVRDVATVGDGDRMRLHRVSMTPRIELPPEHLLQEGAMLEGYVRKDGLHVTAQVSGREIVRGLWEFLRDRGVDLETKRLQRTTDADGGRLTDPQFEALTTAYEMGYFDESTRVTQPEIADELGISRPSFSERLRRAEQRLIEKQLRHAD